MGDECDFGWRRDGIGWEGTDYADVLVLEEDGVVGLRRSVNHRLIGCMEGFFDFVPAW